MRTIRIRVVIDMGIGIIRGMVVRVVTLEAVGLVIALAGLVIRTVVMVVRVPGVLPAVDGRAIRVMVVPVLAMDKRLVITKRGVV